MILLTILDKSKGKQSVYFFKSIYMGICATEVDV